MRKNVKNYSKDSWFEFKLIAGFILINLLVWGALGWPQTVKLTTDKSGEIQIECPCCEETFNLLDVINS